MDKEVSGGLLIRNKLALRYLSEIQKLEKKIRGVDLKKTEIVLNALQDYFISLIKEILSNYKIDKNELEEFVNDKVLLKKHIII
jgi:hypothetical protein